MNTRGHSREMLSIVNKLKGYLPRQDENVYTKDHVLAFFDDIIKNQIMQDNSVSLKEAVDEIRKRIEVQLLNLPKDNQSRIETASIENAIVQAYYSYFFEKTYTRDDLLKVQPKNNIAFEMDREQGFTWPGINAKHQIAIDCNREVTINRKKIIEPTDETIERDINAIVGNGVITKNLLESYSQLPSYCLPGIVINSLVMNNNVQIFVPSSLTKENKARRNMNIEVIGKDIFLIQNIYNFPVKNLLSSKIVDYLGSATARFKYVDDGKQKGFELVDIKTTDPYIIQALSRGIQFSPEEMTQMISGDNALAKKLKINEAKVEDIHTFYPSETFLLDDFKVQLAKFSKDTGADGINELIRVNDTGNLSLADIEQIAEQRLNQSKQKMEPSFFSKKPFGRDAETHLFYQACAGMKDSMTQFKGVNSVKKLVIAEEKVQALHELNLKLNHLIDDKKAHKEAFNEYNKLIKTIKLSETDESLKTILKQNSSPLYDKDPVIRKLMEKSVDVDKLMEKFQPQSKQSILKW